MSTQTVTFNKAQIGVFRMVNDGETVSASADGAGIVLRKYAGNDVWQDVETPSPFVHSGPATAYRQDCTTYPGTPVTATITVTEAG